MVGLGDAGIDDECGVRFGGCFEPGREQILINAMFLRMLDWLAGHPPLPRSLIVVILPAVFPTPLSQGVPGGIYPLDLRRQIRYPPGFIHEYNGTPL